MSWGEESMPSRASNSGTTLGGCKCGFYIDTPKNSKEERCHHGCCRSIFEKTYSIPCHKTDDASHVIELYFKEIIHLYWVLKTIVPDQKSNFLSYLWKTIQRILGTKLLFSTTSHSQTDGQTKVANAILTTLLQYMVIMTLKDQYLKLVHARFVYNRSPSYTTSQITSCNCIWNQASHTHQLDFHFIQLTSQL